MSNVILSLCCLAVIGVCLATLFGYPGMYGVLVLWALFFAVLFAALDAKRSP